MRLWGHSRKAERVEIEEQLTAAKKERARLTRNSTAALTRFQRVLRKAPAIELELLDFKHTLWGTKE